MFYVFNETIAKIRQKLFFSPTLPRFDNLEQRHINKMNKLHIHFLELINESEHILTS